MPNFDPKYYAGLYELQQLKIKEGLLESQIEEREEEERRRSEVQREIEERKRSILVKTLELSRKGRF